MKVASVTVPESVPRCPSGRAPRRIGRESLTTQLKVVEVLPPLPSSTVMVIEDGVLCSASSAISPEITPA